MAGPELHQEGKVTKIVKSNDSETPKGVGQVKELAKSNNEQLDLTPWQAGKKAREALNSKETIEILDKMKKIEEHINAIKKMPGTERVKTEMGVYSLAIDAYEKIKIDIQQKMEEDPYFKEAMKQVWEHLDRNDQPLNTIEEPTASEMAWEVLMQKETPKQIKKINYVMSKYYRLNPSQQEALNKWLATFKEKIENVARDLGLD